MKYSLELFFITFIFEFMIHTAPQGSKNVNGREKYSKAINFKSLLCSSRLVQWYETSLFNLRWRKLGCRLAGQPPFFFRFFFLSSYFYSLACFCLFSLLTLFSFVRFCDNVFLVGLAHSEIINSYAAAPLARNMVDR